MKAELGRRLYRALEVLAGGDLCDFHRKRRRLSADYLARDLSPEADRVTFSIAAESADIIAFDYAGRRGPHLVCRYGWPVRPDHENRTVSEVGEPFLLSLGEPLWGIAETRDEAVALRVAEKSVERLQRGLFGPFAESHS